MSTRQLGNVFPTLDGGIIFSGRRGNFSNVVSLNLPHQHPLEFLYSFKPTKYKPTSLLMAVGLRTGP